MTTGEYGPFANVIGIACALVASFSLLLLKTVGRLTKWSWLAGGSPPFLISAGARVVAVAIMALTYLTIDASNYRWFAWGAAACGIIAFVCLIIFDRLRQNHVITVPLLALDGSVLRNPRGGEEERTLIIGAESTMRPEAAAAFKAARERDGASLKKFVGGYGTPNDPGGIWEQSVLSKAGSRLTTLLMCFVLLAVVTLFLAAFSIDTYGRPHSTNAEPRSATV